MCFVRSPTARPVSSFERANYVLMKLNENYGAINDVAVALTVLTTNHREIEIALKVVIDKHDPLTEPYTEALGNFTQMGDDIQQAAVQMTLLHNSSIQVIEASRILYELLQLSPHGYRPDLVDREYNDTLEEETSKLHVQGLAA